MDSIIDDKLVNQLISNNIEISHLLSNNEGILRKAGFCPPVKNYSVNKNDRIQIPSGYIRTTHTFLGKYHLQEIVKSQNTIKNISYALQLTDFYHFLITRFNIWGSIETMLYKQAFVNIVSIIEALILECANNMNDNCKKCPKIGKCANNICKKDREKMINSVLRLYELNVISLDVKENLIELYDLRNKLHIRLNKQNEFTDNKYNMALYNRAMESLKKVDEQIWRNGVALYSSCIGYKSK